MNYLHILVKLPSAEYVMKDNPGNRNIGKTRNALIFQFSSRDLVVMIA